MCGFISRLAVVVVVESFRYLVHPYVVVPRFSFFFLVDYFFYSHMDSGSSSSTLENPHEDSRQRLRMKIDRMKSRRARRRPGEETKTKAQSVDDILQNLGIDPASQDGKQVKEKLVVDMRSGKVSNVAQLSEWLALNAPVSVGVDPSQALSVRDAAVESMKSAASMTERLLSAGKNSNSK